MTTGLGQWLFALLGADAGVAALVAARIYPLVMPQPAVVPALVYQVINDSPLNSLQGPSLGLRQARLQIDCYANAYVDASTLADTVETALATTAAGGGQRTALLQGRRDLYEADTKLSRISLDFSVWSNTA